MKDIEAFKSFLWCRALSELSKVGEILEKKRSSVKAWNLTRIIFQSYLQFMGPSVFKFSQKLLKLNLETLKGFFVVFFA